MVFRFSVCTLCSHLCVFPRCSWPCTSLSSSVTCASDLRISTESNDAVKTSPVHFAKHVCSLHHPEASGKAHAHSFIPVFLPLLGYLCVCLILPPASGVLEDQGDSWLLAPGLLPLPHTSRCPRLCCLMAETGPSSRAVSTAAVHQLLQRSRVVSSSAGLCSWLKPRQTPVGDVIDPPELHLTHKVLI